MGAVLTMRTRGKKKKSVNKTTASAIPKGSRKGVEGHPYIGARRGKVLSLFMGEVPGKRGGGGNSSSKKNSSLLTIFGERRRKGGGVIFGKIGSAEGMKREKETSSLCQGRRRTFRGRGRKMGNP